METHLQFLQLCRVDRVGYDGGGVGWDGDGGVVWWGDWGVVGVRGVGWDGGGG